MTLGALEQAALCRVADMYAQSRRHPQEIRQQYIWALNIANASGRIGMGDATSHGVHPSCRQKKHTFRMRDCTRHPLWRMLQQRGWLLRDYGNGGWRIAIGDLAAPPHTTPFDALDKPRDGADYRFSDRVAKAMAETCGYGREKQIARAATLLRQWKKGTQP